MAYRCGDRYQQTLLPPSIEEYVSADDPVRAYDAFIEVLNLKELGISYDWHKVGNSTYEPKSMLKLLVYGCSYGWHSSRKLERALHHNVSFMWLTGGLKPDHKTISEFRRKNKKALGRIIKQCARVCLKMELIEGNVLFIDSSKIKANASKDKNYTEEYYKELDKRIEAELEKADRADEAESRQGSYVKMKNNKDLRATIKTILAELKGNSKNEQGEYRTRNLTDPESRLMKSSQGKQICYSIQNVVDEKNGLIISTQAESEENDVSQFAKQIKNAEETLNKKSKIACADAGYSNTKELAKIDKQETLVIVPTKHQAQHKPEKPFNKNEFSYDKQKDCYRCPEGQRLKYKGVKEKGKIEYRIEKAQICKHCKHFGICTKADSGRRIIRLRQEELKEKFERQYEQNQQIYVKRKTIAERPFAYIKHIIGKRNFLTRGKNAVEAEISLASTCFNIVRMLTILGGTQKFIGAMATVG
jgi:transposase